MILCKENRIGMDGSRTPPSKTRWQIEDEVMEELRHRQLEWTNASEEDRDLARQKFLNTLHIFNSLILYNGPDDSK